MNGGFCLCVCVYILRWQWGVRYIVRHPFPRLGMFFVFTSGGSKTLQGAGGV